MLIHTNAWGFYLPYFWVHLISRQKLLLGRQCCHHHSPSQVRPTKNLGVYWYEKVKSSRKSRMSGHLLPLLHCSIPAEVFHSLKLQNFINFHRQLEIYEPTPLKCYQELYKPLSSVIFILQLLLCCTLPPPFPREVWGASAGQLLRYFKVQTSLTPTTSWILGARWLLAVLGLTISDNLFYTVSRYNVHVLPLWLFITVCN